MHWKDEYQICIPEMDNQDVLRQFEALEHQLLRRDMKNGMLPKIAAWLSRHIIDGDKPFARYAIDRLDVPARALSAPPDGLRSRAVPS